MVYRFATHPALPYHFPQREEALMVTQRGSASLDFIIIPPYSAVSVKRKGGMLIHVD